MKLTPVNKKLENSMWDSIYRDVSNKTWDSISFEVRWKINNEICNPNMNSIQDIQIRTLNNLKNEINSSK